jgi:hypothetical protein
MSRPATAKLAACEMDAGSFVSALLLSFFEGSLVMIPM